MQIRFWRAVSIVLLSVGLTIFIVVQYSNYLDRELSKFEVASANTDSFSFRDKGEYLLQKHLDTGLFLMGSSELWSEVPENPKDMFPNQDFPYGVNRIGHAHVQSLLDIMRLGALEPSEKDKVVVVVSLQWFLDTDIDRKGTQANFSELQFYQFMDRKDIDQMSKKYVCERVTKQMKNERALSRAYLYATTYKADNFFMRFLGQILHPYYIVRKDFLILRDKYHTYQYFKNNKISYPAEKYVDWALELERADMLGKNDCTNNDLYVYDEYYNKYLRDRMSKLQGSAKDVNLLKSKELDDYKMFLNICQQKGIQPYIVFMSTNGRYYDYIGIDQEKRYALYDCLEALTNEYGFQYLDLRDKEYEPYFYKDVMHLGWKGWIYVNQQITEHFTKSES